jgi:hypothetical protein
MRDRTIVVLASVGVALVLALGLVTTAKAAKHKRAHAVHTVRHQAVRPQSGSQFQGGVLKGPLYNGQDYLGDDPDPNIRSFLIRDKSRYGGQD